MLCPIFNLRSCDYIDTIFFSFDCVLFIDVENPPGDDLIEVKICRGV
jgi:hypothetical protein